MSLASFAIAATAATPSCPAGSLVDAFEINGTSWAACEDLQRPDGAIVLASSAGDIEWFSKSYEPYAPGPDSEYFLGLDKTEVLKSPNDTLAIKLLNSSAEPTWAAVEKALPPIRRSGGGGDSGVGVRSFVGSRSAVADSTFTDTGEDASNYGFPSPTSFVFNLTNVAQGGSLITKAADYLNASGMADGLVGGHLPVMALYFPLVDNSPYLPANSSGSRYWTMIACPVADMQGSREQAVWFRFAQLQCAGPHKAPPCKLVGPAQYWDTFWWSRAPDGDTGRTGPQQPANASGFYSALLANRRYWEAELAAEGMMEVILPSPPSTNGSWLKQQAVGSIVRAMVGRHDTWHPRYGVTPGYGQTMQNGFEDIFTGQAMAALEWGAMPWAKGLIDNEFRHYLRDDGMVVYRGEEVAQQARMLTILHLYHAYSGGDSTFMLAHFDRAKALADWLAYRRITSLAYPSDDPRHGLLLGSDEADNFKSVYFHQHLPLHWYSSTAEAYRAFAELGESWVEIGKAAGREDVEAHGNELLRLAPLLYSALHTSLNRTVQTTTDAERCWQHTAEPPASRSGQMTTFFRGYPEMFYSGALTAQQTSDIYQSGLGATKCNNTGRFLAVGAPSSGTNIFSHTPMGWPFGLLQHDMIHEFLLHFYTHSAHANTRGTWTTPESSHYDRDSPTVAYASAGVANVPLCLKWALVFEEPETRTLWIGKAVPRDWLAAGEAPTIAEGVTTRYGRVSFRLSPPQDGGAYVVRANVTLPATASGAAAPAGGLRLRIRAPPPHTGKLSSVTVGGKAWTAFDASAETIDFAAADLTPAMLRVGLPNIVATFAGPAHPLRRAAVDVTRRVVPRPSVAAAAAPVKPAKAVALAATPACPAGSLVDTFEINGTSWAACEDLQRPDGAIVLASSAGEVEWFSKGYEPYGTNLTDGEYYLGLGKAAVANGTSDVLGAKLLRCNGPAAPICEPSWAAVEKAVPPIRKNGRTMRLGGRFAGSNCDGVRSFVGSRGASVDAALSDQAWDCSWDGWPSVSSLGMNQHNKAVGEPPQVWNTSGLAEGLIGGGTLPALVFYIPVNSSGPPGSRYWTYTAVPKPDMQGSREQGVWLRLQQVACAGADKAPPCKLHGWPEYWDSFWYARFPGNSTANTDELTGITGPQRASRADGFFAALLANRRYWEAELAAEGMMEVTLPSPPSTNGSWLKQQAVHSIVRSMITRERKWHPRYGVTPGYGWIASDGLPDVFTSTMTAALEWGAMPFAEGVLDNYLRFYVRPDGMLFHQGMELAQSCRVLTVLALYHSYGGSSERMLTHFERAKALAQWLLYRRSLSLSHPPTDPRHGIPPGDTEAANFPALVNHSRSPLHYYSSAAEMYRAFTEMGRVWSAIGAAEGRADVIAHGVALLQTAPLLLHDLRASLNRTAFATGNPAAPRCWPAVAEGSETGGQETYPHRSFPELMHSGALSKDQVEAVYACMANGANRSMVVGVPGWGNTLAAHTTLGLAYGLLQHDLIEHFLLHFFAISAHAYTRGSWTTPESANVADRDEPSAPYASAAIHSVPIYLKWALVFEEPESRTLWIGKAVPRDWLAAGEASTIAEGVTTRYGRVSFRLSPSQSGGAYVVRANLTLPATASGAAAPAGGLRLRIRAPPPHTGKLSSVTVGGKAWTAFDASAETIDFAAGDLTPAMLRTGLPAVVVEFD